MFVGDGQFDASAALQSKVTAGIVCETRQEPWYNLGDGIITHHVSTLTLSSSDRGSMGPHGYQVRYHRWNVGRGLFLCNPDKHRA